MQDSKAAGIRLEGLAWKSSDLLDLAWKCFAG